MITADERLRSAARHLVEQLQQLKRLHRAGINPHFGVLEDLFDATALVDRCCGDAEAVTAPGPTTYPGGGGAVTPVTTYGTTCAMQPCDQAGITPIVVGSALICQGHAEQIRRALAKPAEARR